MSDIDDTLKLVIRDHRTAAAADMREKASKIAQDHAQFCMDEANKGGDWNYLKDRADCAAYIAERIRALSTEPQSAAPNE